MPDPAPPGPKPTWEPIWLACSACRHRWDDWQPCHVPIDSYVAYVRTFRCPGCGGGADVVTLRSTPLEPE